MELLVVFFPLLLCFSICLFKYTWFSFPQKDEEKPVIGILLKNQEEAIEIFQNLRYLENYAVLHIEVATFGSQSVLIKKLQNKGAKNIISTVPCYPLDSSLIIENNFQLYLINDWMEDIVFENFVHLVGSNRDTMLRKLFAVVNGYFGPTEIIFVARGENESICRSFKRQGFVAKSINFDTLNHEKYQHEMKILEDSLPVMFIYLDELDCETFVREYLDKTPKVISIVYISSYNDKIKLGKHKKTFRIQPLNTIKKTHYVIYHIALYRIEKPYESSQSDYSHLSIGFDILKPNKNQTLEWDRVS